MNDINRTHLEYYPIEQDLRTSYKDFFEHAIDLIKRLDGEEKMLKIVVNMQIALELFLKYYFLRKEKYDWLFSNKTKKTFKDFSEILNLFFNKDNELLVTKKAHLKNLLEARNKIVHTGKNNLNANLRINLINTALFIQNVLNREFQETLFTTSYSRTDNNELANNIIWREGSENFAYELAKNNDSKVYACWFCGSQSFLDKRLFSYDEWDDGGFQCATCLNAFYLEHQIGLAQCFCGEKVILDALNPVNKLFRGKCLECDSEHLAYQCEVCETFFLETEAKSAVFVDDRVFCSPKCENQKFSKLKY